jgi:glutaredoxin 3
MDQKAVVVYIKPRSLYGWRARRLLRRTGYAFEVVELSNGEEPPPQPIRRNGRRVVPQVYVDGRPVGGLGAIKALDRSGDLDRLVRGEV